MKNKSSIPDEIRDIFRGMVGPPRFQGNVGDNPMHAQRCMCESCHKIWKFHQEKKSKEFDNERK